MLTDIFDDHPRQLAAAADRPVPQRPAGRLRRTLILSVLGIALAFPLSVLLALARLSHVARCCSGRRLRSSTSRAACRC